MGAFALGGYIGPLVLIAITLTLAQVAGVLVRLVRASVLLSLPIVISVILVSVFTRAGTTVLFENGPFDATLEGVEFAAQTLVRLLAISTSIGLFVLTTDPRALVLDLERRGVSPRFAFVAVATIEAVPTLVDRAATIGESQRARGLDQGQRPGATARPAADRGPRDDHLADRCRGAQPCARVARLQPARPAPSPVVDAGHDAGASPSLAAPGSAGRPHHAAIRGRLMLEMQQVGYRYAGFPQARPA